MRPWWNSLAGMEWTRAPRLSRTLRASVPRARVDDDDLDLLVDPLSRDGLEAANEVGAAVLDRDDDRDQVALDVESRSRRSGMVSSARKNAPNTIWMPSPSPVTRRAVS